MTAFRWGLVALVVFGVVDLLAPVSFLVVPAAAFAPLLAASDGPPRNTLALGVGTVALAAAAGLVHDLTALDRLAALASTIGVVLIAWRLAVFRTRREATLRDSRPHVERSLRLASAMTAGEIGEWSFDAATGLVRWDPVSRRLFGAPDDVEEIDLHRLSASVAAEDRGRFQAVVNASADRGDAFRVDLPVRHGDGSTHWIEVVGEAHVADGRIGGVAGLIQSIDERRHEIEERDRLLVIEASARRRVEFLDRANEVLLRSIDVGEIIDQVTQLVVPDLADHAIVILSADRGEIESQFYDAQVRHPSTRIGVGLGDRGGHDSPDERLDAWLRSSDYGSLATVPIVGPLGVLGHLHLARDRTRFPATADEVELADELASRVGGALNTAILYGRLDESRQRLQGLQAVTGELARAATFRDVTQVVLDGGRTAIAADGVTLFSRDRMGRLRLEGTEGSHVAIALQPMAERAAREVQMVEVPLDGGGDGGAATAAAVPLEGPNRVLGVLVVVFDSGHVLRVPERTMMLEALGSLVAAAVERSETFDRDHDIALVLQRRLLPDLSQVPPWLEAAARYEPATGGPIGGDWYQIEDLGDGHIALVVGDAVGHGLVSAAAMGQLRAAVTTALAATRDPAEALTIVDRFAGFSPDTLGASLGVLLLDGTGGLLHASAGHPPPLLVPQDGPVRVIDGGRRPLLGYGPVSPESTIVDHVAIGETVVLYSDGLVERRRRPFDAGLAQLSAILAEIRHLDVETICNEVIDRMGVRTEAEDDVALMVVRRIGAP